MGKINKIDQLTNHKFLNLFEFNCTTAKGDEIKYLVSSRAKDAKDLKVSTKDDELRSDAVAIYATMTKDGEENLVLVRQFRYAVGNYVYELPAGLIDNNETAIEAAVREMREETGLTLIPFRCNYEGMLYNRAFYTSAGMTDETCCIVRGQAAGVIDNSLQEDSEEIEVVLVNKSDAIALFEEGNICMKTAFVLMDFIKSNF